MIKGDQRTLEQGYRSAVTGFFSRLRGNYDFLYRKFGDDGLKLIADMSQEYGLIVAQRAKARLESNDLHSVAEYLLCIFDTVARGHGMISTVEKDSDRIIISVDRCPLDFDLLEMCMVHAMMEKTIVETPNPSLTHGIGKSIPAGHRWCEHIIKKR